MSSAVAELENYLQSMLALKPPGVSGSKINSITSLCTANVQVRCFSLFSLAVVLLLDQLALTSSVSRLQNESVLIQKIYTHFKKAPGTHKLGVLYVVDSVTRQWVEAARRAGQPAGSAAPDGTFAAGVNRVTELLPVLMTDIINNAPEDQKVRTRRNTRRTTRLSQNSRASIRPATHGDLLRVPWWPLRRTAPCISRYIPPCLLHRNRVLLSFRTFLKSLLRHL